MGTRCDFYVGRGPQAEWLGSYPWDGYPSGVPEGLFKATTEHAYREKVTDYLAAGGENSTLPAHGWPWPWNNSQTTDYAYAFEDGKVWASCFGHQWFDPLLPEPEIESGAAKVEFPDMSAVMKPTLGARSGFMVFASPK